MPNIATVLKEEITRLARKETRSQVDPARKAGAQQRKEIAALKRRVAQLERQVALLVRSARSQPGPAKPDATAKRMRFTARGLRAHRSRLGLSAADFGSLVGVSAQSVYNWEGEKAQPRGEQLARLVSIREIGKREAGQRLKQLATATGKGRTVQ
jgi:DNA-binding XRE family transcriptional regulator